MPATDWGFEITAGEIESWILHHDDQLLVVNKPGGVVCHPSKHGPWSSMVGAAREYLGVERLHMPSRLDRETSGVVVFAKAAETAARMQRALQNQSVVKTYLAVLTGELAGPVTVDQPIGPARGALVVARQAVTPSGRPAVTLFEPLTVGRGLTLARVSPRTGRMHQIRVHAAWLGHPVLGDKIYGPDERHFLEFIQSGFTSAMLSALQLPRHALHAAEIRFPDNLPFHAPLPDDLTGFCRDHALTGDAVTPLTCMLKL